MEHTKYPAAMDNSIKQNFPHFRIEAAGPPETSEKKYQTCCTATPEKSIPHPFTSLQPAFPAPFSHFHYSRSIHWKDAQRYDAYLYFAIWNLVFHGLCCEACAAALYFYVTFADMASFMVPRQPGYLLLLRL